MKQVFLGLLMLTLVNTPLANAQRERGKADQLAVTWLFVECAVEEGFLLPERSRGFYAYLIGLDIKKGKFTLQEVKQITNEVSFQGLKNLYLEELGGCRNNTLSESSKKLAHKFLRWHDKNH